MSQINSAKNMAVLNWIHNKLGAGISWNIIHCIGKPYTVRENVYGQSPIMQVFPLKIIRKAIIRRPQLWEMRRKFWKLQISVKNKYLVNYKQARFLDVTDV